MFNDMHLLSFYQSTVCSSLIEHFSVYILIVFTSREILDENCILDPLVNAVTEFNQTAKEFIDRSKSMDTNK